MVELLLEGAEEAVPDEEDADVVAVEIDIVLRVMDAMVRRCLDPAVEKSETADVLRVRPELVEELNHPDAQIDYDRHAAERQRQVEDPTGERSRARLPQSRGEVELLALVMHHVGRPEESHGV